MVVLATMGVVISAVYGLRAVAKIFYGSPTAAFEPLFHAPLRDIRAYERWPAVILLGALMFVGFWPPSITRGINEALPPVFKATQPEGAPQMITVPVTFGPGNPAPPKTPAPPATANGGSSR